MELVLSTDLEKDNWVSGGCTDSLASRDKMCFPPNLFALYDLNLQCTKLSIGHHHAPLKPRYCDSHCENRLNSIRCCHSLRSIPHSFLEQTKKFALLNDFFIRIQFL